jgi:hypothetical protein
MTPDTICPPPPAIGLCPHDYWAAYYENRGARAWPIGVNPYVPQTMAATRWQAGFEKMNEADRSL